MAFWSRHLATVAALLFLLPAPSLVMAEEDEATDLRLKYSLGFDYSRGAYDIEEDTEIFFIPLSIEADWFPVLVKLTVPFVAIDGPSGFTPGNVTSGSDYITESTAGLGQVTARLSYLVLPFHEAAPWLELSGKVTAPTETDDALGSGQWAFSLQAEAFKQYGSLTGFTHLGRTFYTGSRLDDRFYASIGASFRMTRRFSAGLAYDWFEASSNWIEDTHTLVAFAAVKANKKWSIGPYGLLGLSSGSPDYGVGVSFSFRPSGS